MVSMLVGTAFNYDIRISSLGNIIFTHPQAEANSDRATTTVVVLNAPPSFSTQAYEVFDADGSTSTVPVNASSSISFAAVGDDPEDNDYFLLICANSAVPTAATGTTPPECNGGAANRFARSATTTDMTTATATYSIVDYTHPESVEWYAFLCDLAPANSDCSPYNQGSGYAAGATSSSPFYVNHHPVTTNVYTSVDNRDPGGTFTFQASTTDSDVLGGDDQLALYICSTNSWATSTGCTATTFCSTTTPTSDPSCTWTDTAPTPHGNTTYYAFIKDWHELSGTSTWSNTYTIIDVSPSVGDVTVNGGNPITVNLRGASNVVVTASTTFTDQNECGDVIDATSTIKYATSSSDTYECTADNNSCYKITAANCSVSCLGGGSATGYVTCTTSLEYYAIPSDEGYASNPYGVGAWRGLISVFDESFYPFGTSTNGVELNTLEGLEITQTIIDYGTLAANTDTGAVNASTTVINYGNSPLDVGLLVGDMTNASDTSYKILAPQQEFNINPFVYGAGTDGSSTTPGTADVYVTRPHGADITDDIYWGVGVPNVRSGPYTGSTTFMAMVDNNTEAEWW